MDKSTFILGSIAAVIIIAGVSMFVAKRARNKRKNTLETQVTPNVFEKIALQFSDKISAELAAAEKKIRSVVGAEEKKSSDTDKELGMYF